MLNRSDNLYVYGGEYGLAVGLNGTETSQLMPDCGRFEAAGGSVSLWLRIRGNTVNLIDPRKA